MYTKDGQTMVPFPTKAIMDTRLSANSKALLIHFWDLADDDYRFTATQDDMAAKVNSSPRSIRNWIAPLIEHNYVRKIGRCTYVVTHPNQINLPEEVMAQE